MPKTSKQLLPNHYSVIEFAQLKGVSPVVVYYNIQRGKIVPDYIGVGQKQMIDAKAYASFQFPTRSKGRPAKAANSKKKK